MVGDKLAGARFYPPYNHARNPTNAGNDLPSKFMIASLPPLAIFVRRPNRPVSKSMSVGAVVVCVEFDEFAGFTDGDGGSWPMGR